MNPNTLKLSLKYAFYISFLVVIAALSFSVVQSAAGISYPLLVVKSGSMKPVIEPGDIIIVVPVDASQIKADPVDGDVIVFYRPPFYGNAEWLIVHRAVAVLNNGFVTKGDANASEDPWSPVPANYVIGKWTGLKIPSWTGLGFLSLFFKGEVYPPYGQVVLILLIALNVSLIVVDIRRTKRG